MVLLIDLRRFKVGGNNYNVTTNAVAGSITPKTLTATASASNKVYDGDITAAATLAIASAGFVSGETVSATGAATFNTKDVATATTVTVNSTGGGLASNYRLAAGQTAAANITGASNAAFTGKVAGDLLTVATASGTFDTPAVGTGKLVSTTASTTANILRLGSGTGTGSFPEGALAGANNSSLIASNAQRDHDQRCALASRNGADSAADIGTRRLSIDLICD